MTPQRQGRLVSVILAVFVVVALVECKRKEIIVIGGGIAGLAAARAIRNNRTADYHVTVFEARRERYGGRVWTDKKNMPHATGVEADLGGAVLNSAASNNLLLNLTEKLDLQTTKLGPMQLFVTKLNKRFSGTELVEAFIEARKRYLQAIESVKGEDRSVRSVVSQAIDELRSLGQDNKEVVISIMELLPTYNFPDFSSALYQTDLIDFGFDTFVLDGMGELTDRLLSGGDGETHLSIELRTVVRQIKVDDRKKKVIVRLRDGSQVSADAVVVAVPAAVIRDESLMFEPMLPGLYKKALKEIGTSYGNKLIVEFDEVFWPTDVGVFLLADEEAEPGMMQKWLNMHKLVGRPVLVSMLGGSASVKFENMTDEEVKALVRERLTTLFGPMAESREIVKVLRSSWKSTLHSGLGNSYPKVGNDISMWSTLSEPLCPYIYFAGEHTIFKGIGTLHGAYNSGIRAADQIMSELCEQRAREEEQRRQEEERKRKEKEEKKKEKKKEKTKKSEKNKKKDEL
ncbi:polyamine oxidase 4-like [Haliotis rufescens]|uniref:polyamine oxidase 4-like n=1 Tax=Haliotis rufescens TaxID=6454 RepID=UPI00201F3BA0|nr:polyamine oxidase 4-like [Haliotis rufescens]